MAVNNHLGLCTCQHSRARHVPWFDACQEPECECKAFTVVTAPVFQHEKRTYALVMTEHGSVAHILDSHMNTDTSFPALCDISPFPSTWRGATTTEEAERVQQLPVCSKCKRRLPVKSIYRVVESR